MYYITWEKNGFYELNSSTTKLFDQFIPLLNFIKNTNCSIKDPIVRIDDNTISLCGDSLEDPLITVPTGLIPQSYLLRSRYNGYGFYKMLELIADSKLALDF